PAADGELQFVVEAVLWHGRLMLPRILLGEAVCVRTDTTAVEFLQSAHAVVMEMGGDDSGDAALQPVFDPLNECRRKAVCRRRIKDDRFIIRNYNHAIARYAAEVFGFEKARVQVNAIGYRPDHQLVGDQAVDTALDGLCA